MAEKQILEQLTSLLTQANAHITFEDSVANIPFDILCKKPENLPYSIWMLVEHIRIAHADILDFCINADYKALKWPEEYWPMEESPKDEKDWQRSLGQIRKDRDNLIAVLSQPGVDLFSPFPHGDGQNLFREALLIADHTSYHTGQIILIRRLLNDWE
jgi:hypothetical protein